MHYLRELENRRVVIISSIEEQDRITFGLRINLDSADSKTRLEDLYLSYKPKRIIQAQIAWELGLGPLAKSLFAGPILNPQTEAINYLGLNVYDDIKVHYTSAALEGAKQTLV